MNDRHRLSFLLLLAAALGCGGSGTATDGGFDSGTDDAGMDAGVVKLGNCHRSVPDLLSEWGLFKNIRQQIPEDDVLPFEVTSPLFTDYALKHRFVTVTEGGQIAFANDATRWQSPVGTIFVKTFAFPPNKATDPPQTEEQLIETRIEVHRAAENDRLGCSGEPSCWDVHVYVYNEGQTDAICEAGGVNKSVTFTDALDEQVTIENYRVPSNGECRQCHNTPPDTRTLGPSTGMLNRGNDYQGNVVANQIDALVEAGWLSPMPPPIGDRVTYGDPIALIEECQTPACYHEAARSWLDSNCAHCHAADGELDDQGLFLNYANLNPDEPTFEQFDSWGVCRTPTSAGNLTDDCRFKAVDIWPGDPDKSLLLCRLESVVPGEMMPTLGRSVQDEEAIAIIGQWISDLPKLFPGIPTCGVQ